MPRSGNAEFVRDIAKLVQGGAGDIRTRLKYLCKDEIERVDQRFLAAKIQVQWLLGAARVFNRGGHFS